MIYGVIINPDLDKKLFKLTKRNPKQLEMIHKKIGEIIENPHRYKNLRTPRNTWKRVHIDEHFVLCFSIDEINKTIVLEAFDHHDRIYLE